MRIRKIVCVIIVLLTLCGCGKIDGSVLSYAEHAFCADIEGQVDGLEIAARVQVSARDETGARDVKIEFLSPKSLEGITVTGDSDGTGISLEGINVADAGQEWLLAARLLIPEGQVVSIKNSEQGIATVALDSKQTIIIDLNTGAPLEASIDGVRSARVRVTRFEYAE